MHAHATKGTLRRPGTSGHRPLMISKPARPTCSTRFHRSRVGSAYSGSVVELRKTRGTALPQTCTVEEAKGRKSVGFAHQLKRGAQGKCETLPRERMQKSPGLTGGLAATAPSVRKDKRYGNQPRHPPYAALFVSTCVHTMGSDAPILLGHPDPFNNEAILLVLLVLVESLQLRGTSRPHCRESLS